MRVGLFFLQLLYDFCFLVVMLAGAPYFLYQLATASRFRAGFFERFGFVAMREGSKPCLWVHGVSVGETKAARPFVERFAERHPEIEIVLSNTTEGGRALAEKLFPASLRKFYYPLDFSPIVRRVLHRIRPCGIVLMEREIWPSFLLQARRRRIPVFVLNGRLSEKSFRGYRRVRPFFPQFRWVELYCVQNEKYAERFRLLGVPDSRILVTGNIKFDEVVIAPRRLPPDPELLDLLRLREGESVLVGGSTHEPEEAALCRAVRALHRAGLEGLRLIVAPRHPDRTEEVLRSLQSAGGKGARLTVLRREGRALPLETVLVVDTIGELEKFYALADLVYVGGSLVPRGGHNLLEPAAMGKAVVAGPHTFNFDSEVSLLVGAGAMVQIRGEADLASALGELLCDSEKRRRMGKQAVEAIRLHQGAARRTVEAIETRLSG